MPMRTRFRGIDVRDGVLVRGPAGWGEFSPFWDYDLTESRRWWAAAVEAACEGWPAPVLIAVAETESEPLRSGADVGSNFNESEDAQAIYRKAQHASNS